MKRITLITIILYILFPVFGQIQNITFGSINGYNGLTNSAVRDITQDSKGFLWVATLKGLNRFDGNKVKQFYKNEHNLPSDCIESIIDLDENLLIGTDEGLSLYNSNNEYFTDILYETHSIGEVYDIIRMKNGKIYIAALSGIYLFKNHTLQRISSLTADKITGDHNDNLWVLTPSQIKVLSETGITIHVIDISTILQSEIFSEFSAIMCDQQGLIWIGTTNKGVHTVNSRDYNLQPISLSSQDSNMMKYVRCFEDDRQGNIWIGTENGLFVYNINSRSFEHYFKHYNQAASCISDNAIYSIYKSKEDIVWIGSFFGGINYVNLHNNYFGYIFPDGGMYSLKGRATSNIMEDSKGRIWFASEDKGISIFDPQLNKFQYLNESSYPALAGNNVHALTEGPSGEVWIGNFIEGLQKVNLEKKTIVRYYKNSMNKNGPSNNSIYKLIFLNQDTLLIGSNNGVDLMCLKSNTFASLSQKYLSEKRVDDISVDEENIWICTHYDGLFLYKRKTKKLIHYDKRNGLPSDFIYSVYKDSKEDLWFGSGNGGLIHYDHRDKKFHIYNNEGKLNKRNIYGIEEDAIGRLWISTDNGIYLFDKNKKLFYHFFISNPTISNQFNNSAHCKSKRGIIYLGSIYGVCYFYPEVIKLEETLQRPKIVLTDLKILGNKIKPQGKSNILSKTIDNTSDIALRYNQNTLTIDLLILNFKTRPEPESQLRYYMDGMDKKWQITDNPPQSITYTNISPGKYKLIIELVDGSGHSIDKKIIQIKIRPHFLLHWYMIIIYIIIAFSIVIYLIKKNRDKVQAKIKVNIERIKSQNLIELNQYKLNFMTFISHMFKTPLSIIMTIFDDHKQLNSTDFSYKEIDIVNSNLKRLLFLVSQLLEIELIETDHSNIKLTKDDIVEHMKSIFYLFNAVAIEKKINFKFVCDLNNHIIPFDKDKVEKITSNLLSYILKNADSNQNIEFKLKIDQQCNILQIEIHNAALNIDPEIKETMLRPYLSSHYYNNKYLSEGLELAIVNGLVMILNGKIQIESTQQTGTYFIILLPIDHTSIVSEKIKNRTTEELSHALVDDVMYNFYNPQVDKEITVPKSKSVMIVENNCDMNNILSEKLKGKFNIVSVFDGKEAIKKIESTAIDIIISEIQLPNMNGYELCRHIKNNPQYAHIPIIIMSSQSVDKAKIKGLECGANVYIEKPFNIEELMIHINNLLKSHDSIREYYQDMLKFELTNNLNNKEERFIFDLTRFVIENIQNSNLDVDMLAQFAHISRTSLYNKLKSSINMSSVEFITHIRMNIAKEKLINSQLNISEIAYQTGFCSPSYFAKTFKKYFNHSPQALRNNNIPSSCETESESI